jgi:hypothetical protein
VCTVTSDLCRKLNNKIVISFKQIHFTMPVLNLSSRTVYKIVCVLQFNFNIYNKAIQMDSYLRVYEKHLSFVRATCFTQYFYYYLFIRK